MQLTKFLAVILLTGGLLLTGCQQKRDESKGTPTSEKSAAESIPQTSPNKYLTFIQPKHIRFDIMDDLGLSFKFGNAVVEDKKELDLPTEASAGTLTVSGTPKVEFVNAIIVNEGKPNSGNQSFSAACFPIIQADEVQEMLSDFGESFLDGYLEGTVYVASSSSSTPNWAKGLNADLDAEIQRAIDALMTY